MEKTRVKKGYCPEGTHQLKNGRVQKVNVKIYRKHKKRITGKRGEGIRSLQSHFKIKN